MNRNPFVAGLLSLLIPGLGQIYGGRGDKGAVILATAIVIGNLNLIFLRCLSAQILIQALIGHIGYQEWVRM